MSTDSSFTPLSYDQCREALVRLQQYARWMYSDSGGVAVFANNRRIHNGREFSIGIESTGQISATIADNGIRVIYDTLITTRPLSGPDSLDNIDYRVRVANLNSLSERDAEYAREISCFALSLFQRTQAFQFWARSAPETINGIAHDLALAYSPTAT